MFDQQMYHSQDPNAEMIDQLDSDYIYLEMFKAFDYQGREAINQEDLFIACKFMGWERERGKS